MTEYNFPTEIDLLLKALVDTDRIRIIASLISGDKSVEDLSDDMPIKPTKIQNHLALLENSHLVSKIDIDGDLLYSFNQKYLESIARKLFSKPQSKLDLSSFDFDREQTKIINDYFLPDGSLEMIPTKKKKIIAVCMYMAEAFKYQVDYQEKEINEILTQYNQETTTLRRYLVENDFLARESDGSRYWRVERSPS